MEMDNMRENIYSQASEALDDYIHLGYSLMKDYPGVASQAKLLVGRRDLREGRSSIGLC